MKADRPTVRPVDPLTFSFSQVLRYLEFPTKLVSSSGINPLNRAKNSYCFHPHIEHTCIFLPGYPRRQGSCGVPQNVHEMYNRQGTLWDQQPIDQRFSPDISLEPRRPPKLKRLMADQDLKLTLANLPSGFSFCPWIKNHHRYSQRLLVMRPLAANPRLPMW